MGGTETSHGADLVLESSSAGPLFRRMFEDSLDAMVLTDDGGRYFNVNSAACELLGYSREQLLGMSVSQLIAAEGPSTAERYVHYMQVGRERGEFPFFTGSDEPRVAEYSAIRLGPNQHFSVLRDITMRKRLEQELRESEERFRELAHSLHSVFWLVRADYQQTLYVAPQHEVLFGQPLAAIYADFRAWLEVVHSDDRARVSLAIEQYRARDANSPPEPGILEIEYRITRPDAQDAWLKTALFPVRDAAGNVYRYGGLTGEITKQKQMTAKLADAEQNIRVEVTSRQQADVALQRARILQAITDSLLAHADEARLLSEVAERMREHLGAECVAVYRMADDATNLEAVAVTPPELRSQLRAHAPLGSWVWKDEDVDSPASGPGTDDAALLPGCRLPTAIVRLTPHGGSVIGLLVISLSAGRQLCQEDRQMLALIGERVGAAIERSRLHGRLQDGEARLRQLSRQIVETQERERQHIASELHDEIGQLLTALSLQLQLACRHASAPIAAAIGRAQSLSHDLLNRVRQMSRTLRPPMLDALGLLPALTWHLERVHELAHVRVQLTHRGIDRRFAPELEIAVYRVVQEAVTNIVRHAGVSEAIVRVWASSSAIAAQIVDAGIGFDPQASMGSSAGLLGIKGRVALLDGILSIESAPGAGTCITFEIPLPAGTLGGRLAHADYAGAGR